MEMKNIETGEICPAHRIGEDENGKALFAFVDGWSLVDEYGNDVGEFDSDGNYSVSTRQAVRQATRTIEIACPSCGQMIVNNHICTTVCPTCKARLLKRVHYDKYPLPTYYFIQAPTKEATRP